MKLMNYMNRNGHVVERMDDPFTSRIIGCAIQVHSGLGPGFIKSVYHRALAIELTDAGITFRSQVPLDVLYKGRPAGSFLADIVVEDRLLLELKAMDSIQSVHELQVVNYLNATGLNVGLILNFGRPTLQIRRKFKDTPLKEEPVSLQNL